MAYSLLAHLYPFIKGSQEDIATLSLQYLLTQSDKLNRAFTKRLADNMKIELDDNLQYVCQSTGKSEEKERPDMAGVDKSGTEIILCEMKFYATLTTNQPVTYIRRLKDNNGKGLMFVCPLARRTSLWAKLQELCKDMKIENIDDYCVSVDGVRLAIITWTEIIELLKQVSTSADISFTADIAQLEGYCNQMDSEAFIPFTEDDLKAQRAISEERYYQVMDEVIDLLCADTNYRTSKKGLKATAYRKGYTRSLFIDDYTITFNYDRDLWKNPQNIETPFWLALRDDKWTQTDMIVESLKHIPEQRRNIFWNMIFIAIEPLQNATFSEVCEDIKGQILDLINMLKNNNIKK